MEQYIVHGNKNGEKIFLLITEKDDEPLGDEKVTIERLILDPMATPLEGASVERVRGEQKPGNGSRKTEYETILLLRRNDKKKFLIHDKPFVLCDQVIQEFA